MSTRTPLAVSPGAAGPVLAREVIVPLAALLPRDPDALAWQDQALCAQVGGDAWFPDMGESNAEAKRVCRACPVRGECLEYALANGEQWGVWGGMSEQQRSRLKRGAAASDLPAAPERPDPGEARDAIPELTPAEEARFHARLAPGGCGVRWSGDVTAGGYGRLAIYRDKRRVWVVAHRLAYKLATGEDPAGLPVRQQCGTPWCCTPGCLLPPARPLTQERAA